MSSLLYFFSGTTPCEITKFARNFPLGVLKKYCYFFVEWLLIGESVYNFFSQKHCMLSHQTCQKGAMDLFLLQLYRYIIFIITC